MSAFEVKLTPNRLQQKQIAESRQPVEVVMAPFSNKSIVLFEDVPVNKTAKRILRIINTSDDEIQVSVVKEFRPEHNITIEWLENMVPANGETTMELVWSPKMAIAIKETLQLIDNRNFRKEVAVILKSKSNNIAKNVRRFPTLTSASSSHVKTLRLKSPTNAAQRNIRQMSINETNTKSSTMNPTNRSSKRISIGKDGVIKSIEKPSRYSNSNYMPSKQRPAKEVAAGVNHKLKKSPLKQHNPKTSQSSYVVLQHDRPLSSYSQSSSETKENVSPEPQSNILHMIDEMQFTPAANPSNLISLHLSDTSLLDTPYGARIDSHAYDDELNNSHRLKPRCLNVNLLDDVSTISIDSKDLSTLPTNRTFDIKPREHIENSLEYLHTSSNNDMYSNNGSNMMLNQTAVILTTPTGRMLDIIQEESTNDSRCSLQGNSPKKSLYMDHKKEMEIQNRKRDIKLITSPLRKECESMSNLYFKNGDSKVFPHGSLPNLNEMETIKVFEQNRYFNQNSSKKNCSNSSINKTLTFSNESITNLRSKDFPSDLPFSQHEILAQSSRFNLHEITHNQNTSILRNTKPAPISKTNVASSNSISIMDANKNKASKKRCFHMLSLDSPAPYGNELTVPNNKKEVLSSSTSPPKRKRLETQSKIQIGSTSSALRYARPKNWSKTNSASKYKITKQLALNRTPAKIETPIRLYDTELYLQAYINPDPFAATTTCDPFLATTMYLDAMAIERHQVDFKKWLNALVAIPADLATDPNTKIDVGKLFNEVRNKELTLPPTKEQKSIKYLTTFNLETLRREGVQLFLSEEMRLPCSKVAVYIQRNALRLRQDRNLHLDVATQREILELLLCFNPLWLRLGLEIVYSEKINLPSNNDICGLSSFILNRLFRDKILEQRYSKAYALSEEYAEYIKHFTLQKFLFLLLFLDKAKSKHLVTHNPCLFRKKSPYKETREVLLKFSSELLANVGDITRELRRLGYVLSHKQTYLDEFDYAFQNLAVDLRDGVRLTRVMEIILLRSDLTKQLRVPAISRLQRIYNVNLALKALSEADFQLSGGITSNDIVDGHREKTLSLLWQIIYKFRSPKFHAAATIIQKWWRRLWLYVVIRRRIAFKLHLKRLVAATKIQAIYRAYIARKYVRLYRRERTKAAITIQKYYRSHLAGKRFHKTIKAIIFIQVWYRATKLGRQYRTKFLQLRQSAICIQRHWRLRNNARMIRAEAALQQQRRIVEKNKAANIIQSYWRCYKERKQYLRQRAAAITIQRFIRARQKMLHQQKLYQQMKLTVISLQRHYRNKIAMKTEQQNYQRIRTAVIFIQRYYRAKLAARQQQHQYQRIRLCIICIQRKWRATLLARKQQGHYMRLLYYTTIIQQIFRGRKQMRIECQNYQQMRLAVIKIQRRYRGKLLMRRDLDNYQHIRQAACLIQQHYRSYKAMQRDQSNYHKLRSNVICLQRRLREYLIMKRQRSQFLRIKKAAVIIQRTYRAHRLRQIHLNKYQQMRLSAICIQRHFRAISLMRQQQLNYKLKLRMISFIQIKYRAKLIGRQARYQYQQYLCTVVMIQRRFRANILRKLQQQQYQEVRKHIINIQRRFRSYLLMKRDASKFQQQRRAAILIQNWYRSILLMRSQRQYYQKIRQSAITIQLHWRACIEMRQQRQIYLHTLQMIITVQRKMRAKLLMNTDQRRYQYLRLTVTNLQRRYRARLQMLKIRKQYQHLRSAIIFVQRKYRAKRAMQQQRHHYLLLRSVVVHLQQKFRGQREMLAIRKHFLQLRQGCLVVQTYARSLLARNRFKSLMASDLGEWLRRRKAAKTIQSFWRGYLIRKRFRNIKILEIRRNITELKKASRGINTLRFKINEAIRTLSGRFCAADAMNVLKSLDNISRTVPQLLTTHSSFISTFCYGIMAQANRSEVDKCVIEYCSRIILNLARYSSTTLNTFQAGGLVTIAQMLLRWCDKDCEIFNTLCTLIWVFAHCPVQRQIIREFMTTADAIYMVRETKKLVERKEKMKQNLRRPSKTTTTTATHCYLTNMNTTQLQAVNLNFTLPALEPDYGIINNKPYIFVSSVYAFETILCILGIQIF